MAPNITPESLADSSNTSGTEQLINQTANSVGDIVASETFGSVEIAGLGTLIMFGFILWRTDSGMDVVAATMIPSTVFLAANGWLPVGSGIIDGILIGIAAMFGFGLAKYAFR